MTTKIDMPASLTASMALKFRSRLLMLDRNGDYTFDFGGVGHTNPFGLLFVSDAIARFKAEQSSGSSICCNHERMGYQSHMGFFRACGFEYGSAPGEATGSSNYLPVTHLAVSKIVEEAHRRSRAVGDIIEEHAQRIAAILARQSQGDLYEALSYSLREIIRNVVEHSESDVVQFCAQHWQTKNRVHLAILDRGRGIRESLSHNPNLSITSDIDALKLSLMPGVSGRMYKGVRRRRYDVWQNTGYGLYMSSRLAIAGGNFMIVSGESVYGVATQSANEIRIPSFKGTALQISLDTRQLGGLQTRLHRFAEEGREIAREFDGADARGASAASTMIKTRFQS